MVVTWYWNRVLVLSLSSAKPSRPRLWFIFLTWSWPFRVRLTRLRLQRLYCCWPGQTHKMKIFTHTSVTIVCFLLLWEIIWLVEWDKQGYFKVISPSIWNSWSDHFGIKQFLKLINTYNLMWDKIILYFIPKLWSLIPTTKWPLSSHDKEGPSNHVT